ncbi:hypothetical protein [Lysobacter silvisoli]|uniref:hypothetical protein n=1 Tax=Lysobacter silvisoli TaxID=2293254 RepID=UPI0011C057A7|nr:hypothetical protein [Lysobacter silvisoli]
MARLRGSDRDDNADLGRVAHDGGDDRLREVRWRRALTSTVIPAQAGTHVDFRSVEPRVGGWQVKIKMGSGLRRNDGIEGLR